MRKSIQRSIALLLVIVSILTLIPFNIAYASGTIEDNAGGGGQGGGSGAGSFIEINEQI